MNDVEDTVYRENIAPVFFLTPFTLWPEGEFKIRLIKLSIKDYVRKL